MERRKNLHNTRLGRKKPLKFLIGIDKRVEIEADNGWLDSSIPDAFDDLAQAVQNARAF